MKKILSYLTLPLCLLPILTLSLFCNLLPPPLFRALGRRLGLLLHQCKLRTSVVERNLKLAYPQWPQEKREQFLRSYYQNTGIVFLDILRTLTLPLSLVSQRISWTPGSYEKIKQGLRKKKGVIIFAPHLSNWELSAMALTTSGLPVCAVAKKQNSPFAQILISFHRWRSKIHIIYPGGAMEKIKQCLRENHIMIFALDQYQPGRFGIPVNFFNHPARTSRSLAKLAQETQACVIPSASYQDQKGHQSIEMGDPIPYQKGPSQEEEELINTQHYVEIMEEYIKRKPQQWLWMHRRWKGNE